MGYLVPPPPPKFIQYNAGYYVENPGWHFSVAKSTLEKKPKTLDQLIEEEANYDPLTQIKNGKYSFLKLEQEKIDRAQRLGICLDESSSSVEYLRFKRKLDLVMKIYFFTIAATLIWVLLQK